LNHRLLDGMQAHPSYPWSREGADWRSEMEHEQYGDEGRPPSATT
jgi:hypothetical protein